MRAGKTSSKRLTSPTRQRISGRGNRFLKARSNGDGLLNRRLCVFDDKIKMDRRPMALIAPALGSGSRGWRTAGFDQQIDGCGAPEHLDSEHSEAPAHLQFERGT